MANEENLNITEYETNDDTKNEAIVDYEDTQFNVKTFDWNKIWDFTQKSINYLNLMILFIKRNLKLKQKME